MGSAFADCSALYLGPGLYQLLKTQDTTLTTQKNFSKTFGALADYGVRGIFCSEQQLNELGLNVSDLTIPVTALSDTDISLLIDNSKGVLNF